MKRWVGCYLAVWASAPDVHPSSISNEAQELRVCVLCRLRRRTRSRLPKGARQWSLATRSMSPGQWIRSRLQVRMACPDMLYRTVLVLKAPVSMGQLRSRNQRVPDTHYTAGPC